MATINVTSGAIVANTGSTVVTDVTDVEVTGSSCHSSSEEKQQHYYVTKEVTEITVHRRDRNSHRSNPCVIAPIFILVVKLLLLLLLLLLLYCIITCFYHLCQHEMQRYTGRSLPFPYRCFLVPPTRISDSSSSGRSRSSLGLKIRPSIRFDDASPITDTGTVDIKGFHLHPQNRNTHHHQRHQHEHSSHRKPVKVRIYVESLCIDSQRYMYDQILPTYDKLYGNASIMDLQIIMFGNAHYDDDDYDDTGGNAFSHNTTTGNTLICQHGVAECDANVYHLCVQSLYRNDIHRYLPFMSCLFDGRIPMGYSNTTYPPSLFASCAKETGILWSQIHQNCYKNTTMVQELQYQAYIETKRTNRTYVPWVTLNDAHLINEDSKDLFHEILAILQSYS